MAYAGVVRRFEEDVGASGGAVQHLGRGAFGHGAGEGEGGQVHDGAGILDEGATAAGSVRSSPVCLAPKRAAMTA